MAISSTSRQPLFQELTKPLDLGATRRTEETGETR